MGKRGTLIALNPEEMRRALMATIARGIDAGMGKARIDQWGVKVLSCTATFHINDTEATRLQAAMQLRNSIAKTTTRR